MDGLQLESSDDRKVASAARALLAQKQALPWLVAIALFMETLDTTILNSAVPMIAAALDVNVLNMKAALTSYTLSLAVFIPTSGWIADRYGTRRVFFSAIGIFALGSLLCGLAQNMSMLVAARVIQGCGGALMMPVGRISIVRTFPKGELVRTMSFVAMPALIGPLFGPLVGGFLVSYAHWRMIFFINLPIAVCGLFAARWYMPDYRSTERRPLDLIGVVLFSSGTALLSYVFEVFGEHNLPTAAGIGLLGVATALLFAYWFHGKRTEFPLLRLDLFRIRTFRVAIVGGLVARLGVGGMPFLLPLLYQVGLGYTPVESGLLIMPQPLAAMGLKVILPRILSRFGFRRVLAVNTVIIGVLLMLFVAIAPGTPTVQIVLQAFCFGFFTSLQYSSMNSLVYADAPPTEVSMASSISSTAQQMSMTFGVALATLVTILLLHGDRHPTPAELVRGIHYTFLVLGAVTIASSAVFRQLETADGSAVSQHGAEAGKGGGG